MRERNSFERAHGRRDQYWRSQKTNDMTPLGGCGALLLLVLATLAAILAVVA